MRFAIGPARLHLQPPAGQGFALASVDSLNAPTMLAYDAGPSPFHDGPALPHSMLLPADPGFQGFQVIVVVAPDSAPTYAYETEDIPARGDLITAVRRGLFVCGVLIVGYPLRAFLTSLWTGIPFWLALAVLLNTVWKIYVHVHFIFVAAPFIFWADVLDDEEPVIAIDNSNANNDADGDVDGNGDDDDDDNGDGNGDDRSYDDSNDDASNSTGDTVGDDASDDASDSAEEPPVDKDKTSAIDTSFDISMPIPIPERPAARRRDLESPNEARRRIKFRYKYDCRIMHRRISRDKARRASETKAATPKLKAGQAVQDSPDPPDPPDPPGLVGDSKDKAEGMGMSATLRPFPSVDPYHWVRTPPGFSRQQRVRTPPGFTRQDACPETSACFMLGAAGLLNAVNAAPAQPGRVRTQPGIKRHMSKLLQTLIESVQEPVREPTPLPAKRPLVSLLTAMLAQQAQQAESSMQLLNSPPIWTRVKRDRIPRPLPGLPRGMAKGLPWNMAYGEMLFKLAEREDQARREEEQQWQQIQLSIRNAVPWTSSPTAETPQPGSSRRFEDGYGSDNDDDDDYDKIDMEIPDKHIRSIFGSLRGGFDVNGTNGIVEADTVTVVAENEVATASNYSIIDFDAADNAGTNGSSVLDEGYWSQEVRPPISQGVELHLAPSPPSPSGPQETLYHGMQPLPPPRPLVDGPDWAHGGPSGLASPPPTPPPEPAALPSPGPEALPAQPLPLSTSDLDVTPDLPAYTMPAGILGWINRSVNTTRQSPDYRDMTPDWDPVPPYPGPPMTDSDVKPPAYYRFCEAGNMPRALLCEMRCALMALRPTNPCLAIRRAHHEAIMVQASLFELSSVQAYETDGIDADLHDAEDEHARLVSRQQHLTQMRDQLQQQHQRLVQQGVAPDDLDAWLVSLPASHEQTARARLDSHEQQAMEGRTGDHEASAAADGDDSGNDGDDEWTVDSDSAGESDSSDSIDQAGTPVYVVDSNQLQHAHGPAAYTPLHVSPRVRLHRLVNWQVRRAVRAVQVVWREASSLRGRMRTRRGR